MDAAIDLKNSLIERIKSSKNLQFLSAIQTLFDTSEEELFELNESQIDSIEAGRKDIDAGKFTSNEQIINEMRPWLKSK